MDDYATTTTETIERFKSLNGQWGDDRHRMAIAPDSRNLKSARCEGRSHAEVRVELLVIPECPGSENAAKLLRAALDRVGLAEVSFGVEVLGSEDAARSRAFAGSPAFVVDGVDLFETTAGPACWRAVSIRHRRVRGTFPRCWTFAKH